MGIYNIKDKGKNIPNITVRGILTKSPLLTVYERFFEYQIVQTMFSDIQKCKTMANHPNHSPMFSMQKEAKFLSDQKYIFFKGGETGH